MKKFLNIILLASLAVSPLSAMNQSTAEFADQTNARIAQFEQQVADLEAAANAVVEVAESAQNDSDGSDSDENAEQEQAAAEEAARAEAISAQYKAYVEAEMAAEKAAEDKAAQIEAEKAAAKAEPNYIFEFITSKIGALFARDSKNTTPVETADKTEAIEATDSDNDNDANNNEAETRPSFASKLTAELDSRKDAVSPSLAQQVGNKLTEAAVSYGMLRPEVYALDLDNKAENTKAEKSFASRLMAKLSKENTANSDSANSDSDDENDDAANNEVIAKEQAKAQRRFAKYFNKKTVGAAGLAAIVAAIWVADQYCGIPVVDQLKQMSQSALNQLHLTLSNIDFTGKKDAIISWCKNLLTATEEIGLDQCIPSDEGTTLNAHFNEPTCSKLFGYDLNCQYQ